MLPLRRAGSQETARSGETDGLERHDVLEMESRDATLPTGEVALVEVGALRTRLLPASEVTSAYASIPLAHVVECRADGAVTLEDAFIPTVLQVRAAARLTTFTTELVGLLRQRGEVLASRVSSTGRGGAAEIAEFLMLQLVNGYEPLVAHHAGASACTPKRCTGSACRSRANWPRSPRRRNGLRRFRSTGTTGCASRSSRSSPRSARR